MIELRGNEGGELRPRVAVVSRGAEDLAAEISMSKEAAALRLELSVTASGALIQDDCRSIGILENWYAAECHASDQPMDVDEGTAGAEGLLSFCSCAIPAV